MFGLDSGVRFEQGRLGQLIRETRSIQRRGMCLSKEHRMLVKVFCSQQKHETERRDRSSLQSQFQLMG